MTPERWEQVGRLYETACALATDERATFLGNACAGDTTLREEVESLLASDAAAGEYLSAGALSDAARIVAEGDPVALVGRTFDHYTVLSLLGSGGMGDVYRARDSRLGRDVAIKTIPGLVMGSADVRSRFETEARAVAALSHPNVRALHDVGEVEGRLYAVMELLEGESLRARLDRGPLPVRKAVEIGTAIAAGLAAAHSKGIVHRDLKPENVFITTAGQIKVLDFGLAKMEDPALGVGDRDDHAMPQAVSSVVLGTPGYTSPEQASGKDVDTRSDIFSLGCVLYEMVTGHRAFERRTRPQTMAAIAGEEPAELDAIPLDLRRIIARCLEKEPDARFQSAQDLAFALRTIPEAGADTAASATRRARPPRRGRWILAAAAAAVIVAIAASTFPAREPPATIRSFLLPPAGVELCSDCGIALSPDGRRLAFVARDGAATRRQLWVQSLGDASARPVAGTEGARFPFWSPDSQSVAFFSGDTLSRIGASGGAAQRLCSPCIGQGTWGENGIIVFGGARKPLRGVSASGGQPFPVTELDPSRPEEGHLHPVFLPGGRRLLFRKGKISNTGSLRGIYAASIDAKATELVIEVPGIITPNSKVFVAAGRLLFVQENTLMAVPFDHGRVRAEGVAEPVAQTAGPFAVSAAGVLVYMQPAASQLAWVDRNGRELQTLPILGALYEPSLAHDDRRVAITRMAVGGAAAGDIWVYDLARGQGTRLTSDPAHDHSPVWSPDDEWIVFSSDRHGTQDLYRKRSNGLGDEEALPMSGFHGEARSWSGQSIIANDLNDGSNLWHLSLPEETGTVLFKTPFKESSGEISPDGRYMAYVSDETGNTEVYLQSFPPSGERWAISKAGGWWPRWRGDGRELFFLEGDNRNMMAAEVRPGAASPVGVPQPLFAATMLHERATMFDVTADGQRFLVIKPAADPGTGRITLIQNWTAGLRQ